MYPANQPPLWECRWPDPVALKVATERVCSQLDLDRPGLNPSMPVMVQMEAIPDQLYPISALITTPWGVERVFWARPHGEPVIESATPLELDETGRVAKGQGVLLINRGVKVPVVISWEPETGHTLVESLLSPVTRYHSPAEALAVAAGKRPGTPPPPHPTPLLEQTVSRRSLFRWWGG